jgi:hypothetical protein
VDPKHSISYMFEPFEGLLALDYEQQGDQWLDALQKALQQRLADMNGYGLRYEPASADFRYPHYRLTLNGMEGTAGVSLDVPSLAIVPVKTKDETVGLYVALLSKREITDHDKEVWSTSIVEALDKLGEESEEFEWAAAIGQTSERFMRGRYSLKQRVTINGVALRSGRQQYISRVHAYMPSFTNFSLDLSWPIVVEGKSKGYDWPVASRLAVKDLHKTVALISLAWNSKWRLIEAPRPMKPGELKILYGDTTLAKHKLPYPKTAKTVPKWVHVGWQKVDADEILCDALNAYYQGLLLTEEHPSFALIAFISVVEIIGKKIVGEKCACCGTKTGSNQRFRAGIDAVVADKQKAKELYIFYRSRSGTAHEGKLHGNEDLLGSGFFPNFFRKDNKAFFADVDLRKIRAVSRKLLIKAFKGQVKFSAIVSSPHAPASTAAPFAR